MTKVKVKLRDKGSIFHDVTQNATVTSDKVIDVELTDRVRRALKMGVLVLVNHVAEKIVEVVSDKVADIADNLADHAKERKSRKDKE